MEHLDLDGVESARERPFFVASAGASGVQTNGTPHCELGHVLPGHAVHGDDGIFVRWNWDGERLTVENDRYGIYPLFYSHYGGEIRISPAIQHVLNGDFPKALNYPGLAVFLRLGFFLAEDTPFEHVHVLPPGSRLTWEQGQLELKRGSREAHCPSPMPQNFDETVEVYQNLFRQAIERRPPPENGYDLALSGGRDSRHIFLELLHQGHRPRSVVTVQGASPIKNEDVLLANRLARATDIDHRIVRYDGSCVASVLKDAELTSHCSSPHTWLISLAAYFSRAKSECIYDGLAGDILSGAHQMSERKLTLLQTGRTQDLAELLLREMNREPAIKACYRRAFIERIPESLAVDRIAAELERHRGASSPLQSFVFWNRTRRSIALLPFGLLGQVKTIYCPYLDHELFDFLMNVPPGYNMQKAFHDETIKRRFPEVSHIPFDSPNTEPAPQPETLRHYRACAREGLSFAMGQPLHFTRSRLLRSGRLALMLARTSLAIKPSKPWYLQTLLRGMEMDRISAHP
ncbi:asparagine synthase-related protein [Thioalkalivibrio sp. ALJ24]|uniref:asparagine synthase-related protein n=1 Tax=Thioalkalivibrio sp. ALJ24 TaxID=545276 RepID=UPI000688432C|nr:asparagine synthase-related protein [Thioalkalivibrio sp. ALJ24]